MKIIWYILVFIGAMILYHGLFSIFSNSSDVIVVYSSGVEEIIASFVILVCYFKIKY